MALLEIEKHIHDFKSFSWYSTDVDHATPEVEELMLRSFAEDFFHVYLKFIISGEFLKHDNLQELIERLIDECNRATEDDRLVDNKDLYSIVYDASSYFKIWLGLLNRFHFTNTRHFKDRKGEWINDLYRREEPYEPQVIDLSNNSAAIYLTIQLFEIDLQLSTGSNQIAELLRLTSELEHNITIRDVISPYKAILADKINLLINKLIKVEEKEIRNLRHSLDGKAYKLREQQVLSYYKEEDVDLLSSSNYREIYSGVKRKSVNEDCSFADLYVLMKSYKDDSGQLDKATDLLLNLEQRESCVNAFDQWALDVSCTYVYNNILSLTLRSSNELVEIRQLFQKVKRDQELKEVWNYYPFLKIAKKVNVLTTELFNIEEVSDIKIKEHIDLLEMCIKELNVCYLWCFERLNWSFQPTLNECIKEFVIGGETIKVFTASSFVVPINYKKVKEQIDELKDELRNHKELRSSFLLIEKEKGRIIKETEKKANDRIEYFQKENQGLLKQNIEILSIFAAIVLFVSGNIQIFTRINTLNSAIAFTLAFGYVISVFILLISLVIKTGIEDAFKKFKKRVLWFLAISAAIFYLTIIFAPNLPLSKDKEDEKPVIQQTISPQIQIDASETKKK